MVTRLSVRRPVSRVLFSSCNERWPFLWDVRRRTPRATYPDGGAETRKCRPYLVLLPVGLAVPSSLPKPRCALTAPFQPCPGLKPVGGLISVALSLESPPPDIIRHRVSAEPGLSSRFALRRNEQPSGHLTHPECRGVSR
jgi:hypothetical protein